MSSKSHFWKAACPIMLAATAFTWLTTSGLIAVFGPTAGVAWFMLNSFVTLFCQRLVRWLRWRGEVQLFCRQKLKTFCNVLSISVIFFEKQKVLFRCSVVYKTFAKHKDKKNPSCRKARGNIKMRCRYPILKNSCCSFQSSGKALCKVVNDNPDGACPLMNNRTICGERFVSRRMRDI